MIFDRTTNMVLHMKAIFAARWCAVTASAILFASGCRGCSEEPDLGVEDMSIRDMGEVSDEDMPAQEVDAPREVALFDCDGSGGEVPAPEWLQARSEVSTLRYRIGGAGEYDLDLLGEDGSELGTVSFARAPFEAGSPARYTAAFSRDGAEVISAEVMEGEVEPGQMIVRSMITRAERSLEVIARFGSTGCGTPAPLDDELACAGALELEAGVSSLLTCGFTRHVRAVAPEQLISLDHVVTTPSSVIPTRGALRRVDADHELSFPVMRGGRLADADDARAWASEVGVDELLDDPDLRTLSLVLLAEPWRGQIEEHSVYCEAPDLFPTRTSALCPVPGLAGAGLSTSNPCAVEWGDTYKPGDDPLGFPFDCKNERCGAWVWGDPHLRTHDGVALDFQGHGEYVLARGEGGFEVQARFLEPDNVRDIEGCKRRVTVARAVAVRLGGHRIGFYDDGVYVDGQPHQVGVDNLTDAAGGSLERVDAGAYSVTWGDGSVMNVSGLGGVLRVDFALSEARLGEVSGLLGHFDGKQVGEFRAAGGELLSDTMSFTERYDVFGEGWKVRDASLFDYPEGGDTTQFDRADYPAGPVDLELLPDEERVAAREVCFEAGVVDGPKLTDCVLDVVCMGDESLATDAAIAPPPLASAEPGVLVVGDVDLVDRFEAGSAPRDMRCAPTARRALLIEESPVVQVAEQVPLDRFAPPIAPGTRARSYILYTPPSTTDEPVVMSGALRFSGRVLGVQVEGATFSSASMFEDSSLDYPADLAASLGAEDRLTLGLDQRSVDFELASSDTADLVRIIVEVVE